MHQKNQNTNNMDLPYIEILESSERANSPNQVEIPLGFGVEMQNKLVNTLTPIFNHLGNMIQNASTLVTLFTNQVPQNTLLGGISQK